MTVGGDEQAFYERYVDTVRRAARSIVGGGHDLDDVVQDAFEQLFRSRRRGVHAVESERGYVWTVARHSAFRHTHRASRIRTLEEIDRRRTVSVMVEWTIDDELAGRQEVRDALSAVSPTMRAMLWATGAEGRDLGDVAAAFGTSREALAAQTYRARRSIRDEHPELVRENLRFSA